MGFTHMTPVQAAAIPLFMKNKDVVVEVCKMCGTIKSEQLDAHFFRHRLLLDLERRFHLSSQ